MFFMNARCCHKFDKQKRTVVLKIRVLETKIEDKIL